MPCTRARRVSSVSEATGANPCGNCRISDTQRMHLAIRNIVYRYSGTVRFLGAGERVALAKILSLALSILVVLFLLDAAVFRSGFYLQYIEPDSAAGFFEKVVKAGLKSRFKRSHRALVVGDSQVAEGFSALVADQVGAGSSWEFVNAGVGGVSLRNWYYMVRDLDPHRSRFDVVVLPLRGYPDVDDGEIRANREPDIHWMIAHVRLVDLPELCASFPNRDTRMQVLRESIFEGLVYRRDLREFLRNPPARMRHLEWCRANCTDSLYEYPGRSEDLTGLRMDWAKFTLQFPPHISPAVEAEMKAHCDFQSWTVRGVEGAYRKEWLGRIVNRYRGTHTKILIVSLPYRPFPIPLSWPVDSRSFIVEVARDPDVTIADEHLFEDLQRPGYFFDVFHMNRKGRELFSRRLAALIVQDGARNGS